MCNGPNFYLLYFHYFNDSSGHPALLDQKDCMLSMAQQAS
jgi:hypothetical protein